MITSLANNMSKVLVQEIIKVIEDFAPLSLQESYDNAGLLCGDRNMEVKAVLCSLDCTESVIEEAIAKGCNLVLAHHPIIFSGLKKITGANYVERTIIKAIKNNIAIYAAHTNLDNVYEGVNQKMAQKLGLTNTRILAPRTKGLKKLVTFIPSNHIEKVRTAILEAGAGHIGNYDACSFNVSGMGTFRPNEGSNPFIGKKGEIVEVSEIRCETVYPAYLEAKIINALFKAHPYEEPAFDLLALDNEIPNIGSGMTGELQEEMNEKEFLEHLKKVFHLTAIKHTPLLGKKIKKVALCGGAGSFLIKNAIISKSDIYITSDIKYHEFFDAENRIIIADIGHGESEQYTPEIFSELIQKNFATFAVHLSNIRTNPVQYYY